MGNDTLYLIDGSSYIFRAYYAITRLSTSRGFPTNAIYGFTNMLLKVIEEKKPKYLGIIFDTGKPTFRKELYAEYKSNRQAPPDDLVPQFPHIPEAATAVGLIPLSYPGYEADDVIASLARQAAKDGVEVEIISGDKDLMQLVTETIKLYDPMTDKTYDSKGVEEKFGVKPHQVVDYLALMGDSSDNIPGVAGIGKKTAAELLVEFGSLDGVYQRLTEIKSEKRRETLISEKENAFLSRKLALLADDLTLPLTWKELKYQGFDAEKLAAFLHEFEFHALIKRLGLKPVEEKSTAPRAKVIAVQDEALLKKVVKKLEGAALISVDTETTSLHTQSAEMVGISLCADEKETYYVPIGHTVGDLLSDKQGNQIDAEVVRELLRPLLENPKIKKTGQNLKYDSQIFRRWGINLGGIVGDTMLASYLLDPDEPHNLDTLAKKYLNIATIKYEDVTGKGKSQKSFAEVEIGRAAEYSGEDAEVAFKLDRLLTPDLKNGGLEKLYRDIEVPLLSVLADMEFAGVSVDRVGLERMSKELARDLGAEEKEIYTLAGEPFNINSPKQLGKILFEKLKLPVIKRTKTGISTDEAVLEKLSKSHDICKRIVTYRGLGKLRSTYVEGLLAQVHERTGRIHTHYNQTIAATGRLSSSNPNLQNIPVGGEAQYDIRKIFVPEPGWQFLSADYSQVELRLLADMSGDPELSRAFHEDEDVHAFTAKLIFGVTEVDADQRRIAKTINFGVVYGQTPFGLSQLLGISTTEAKAFIDRYFERYAKVRSFLQGLAESARQTGFAVTKLGRRRHVKEIHSKNRMVREMAERAAINTPLQGTAADMIKIAMINVFKRLKAESLKSRMVLQVHDELVLEVAPKEHEKVERLVKEEMESALTLSVPLKVAVGWGSNWSEC